MYEPKKNTRRWIIALSGAAVVGAGAAFQLLAAQERQVVSNQIAVSNSEATLTLEFTNRDSFEISFREGVIHLDGRELGTYERGGALDASWRALLGRAVALDDGPLAQALTAWEPSDGLEAPGLAIATELSGALGDALSAPSAPTTAESASRSSSDPVQNLGQLRSLLDRLGGLAEALDGVDIEELSIYVGEDVTIDEATEVEGTLVVVDGDLSLYGEIDGDVVLAGGSVRIYDGAVITGDVRLADARLYRDGGTVEGRIRDVEGDRGDLENRIRDEIRTEMDARVREDDRPSAFRPLRYVVRGFAGLVQTVLTLGIVMMFGFGVIYFGRERLEVVAEAARTSPGRAALVGIAGGFLFFPVWVLGTIALCVSIIGIPVLILWVPLFPLAGALATGLGFLAVAVNLGEWLERRDIQALEWIRASNPLYTMLAGVGALIAPFALGHVAEMGGPLLGFIQGLLGFVGSMACFAVFTIGFGAVLLTRAGRRRDYDEAMMEFDLGRRPWSRRRSRAGVDTADVEIEDLSTEDEVEDEAGDQAPDVGPPEPANEAGDE